MGLLLKQMSMSLAIGLIFCIFVSDNGEVPWSIKIFFLQTFYDPLSLLCIQN